MYYVLFNKILKGADAASRTVLHKKVFKNLWLKLYIDTPKKSF